MKMKKEHIATIHNAIEEWLTPENKMKVEECINHPNYRHITLAWNIFRHAKVGGNSMVWFSDNCPDLNDTHLTTVLVRELRIFFPHARLTTGGTIV